MAKKRIKKVVEVGGLLRGPFSYIWHQGLPSSMSCHCECTCTRALFMKKKKHFFLVNTHFGYGRFCSGWKIHFYSMVCCKVYFEYRTSYIKDTSNLQNNLILIKDDSVMRTIIQWLPLETIWILIGWQYYSQPMRLKPLQSVNRIIYQNVYLTLHFFQLHYFRWQIFEENIWLLSLSLYTWPLESWTIIAIIRFNSILRTIWGRVEC